MEKELDEIIQVKDQNLTIDGFIESCQSNASTGLSTGIVKQRLLANGQNILVKEKKDSVFKVILHQFKDLLNVMLLIIAIVDFVFAPIIGGEAGISHIVQGAVIFTIVFVNMLLSVIQEIKAAKALDSLMKNYTPTTKVIRDGIVQTILTADLVIGDIVYLEDGVIVPADLRLIETNSLKIEEGALTGESLPVEKDATEMTNEKTAIGDRVDYAFASTVVSYGSGMGIVCATGMNTQIGKIASSITEAAKNKELPPLKRKINSLVKILTYFAFGILALMLMINIILFFAHFFPNAVIFNEQDPFFGTASGYQF
jgi:Ca2+-transporting ATPase